MCCCCFSDFNVESWCRDNFLNPTSLETAESLRSELRDILSRIELPVSEAAFGTQTNTLNIKRALLSGFFMQVRDAEDRQKYSLPGVDKVGVRRQKGVIKKLMM